MSDLINHSLHLHNLLSRLVGKTPNVKRKKRINVLPHYALVNLLLEESINF